MKVSEIINMSLEDFNKLDLQSAKEALKSLNKAARQKVSRLEKAGVAKQSPAYRAFSEQGVTSVRGLNLNQLRAQIARTSDFLTAKTSNIKAVKQYVADITNRIGLPADASDEDIAEAYEIFHRMQEANPALLTKAVGAEFYSKALKRIGRGGSESDIRKDLQRMYEEEAEAEAEEQERMERSFFGSVPF